MNRYSYIELGLPVVSVVLLVMRDFMIFYTIYAPSSRLGLAVLIFSYVNPKWLYLPKGERFLFEWFWYNNMILTKRFMKLCGNLA